MGEHYELSFGEVAFEEIIWHADMSVSTLVMHEEIEGVMLRVKSYIWVLSA